MTHKDIVLTNCTGEQIPYQLTQQLLGLKKSKWGETFIEFDNDIGKGLIRIIEFNWGITMINFDVIFSEDTHFKLGFEEETPVDFLFLNSGEVKFYTDTLEPSTLKSYQNIIIHYKPHSESTFIFKKNKQTELNIIQIIPGKYLTKKNNNIDYLNERIKQVFDCTKKELYNHFGNFNLRIADQINQMNQIPHDGIIRTLILEGHLNIILGLQILEHQNFVNQITLPETLSQNDIERVQNACELIKHTISDKITVANLARQVLLSPGKLQLGFKLLHSQTVNEYIKEAKLQFACELLKNRSLTVSEIVYKVGYNSRSYFSRIFSERFGILPTDYRKNLK